MDVVVIPIQEASCAVDLHPLYTSETTKIIQSQLQELLPYATNFAKLEVLLSSSSLPSLKSSTALTSTSEGIALYCEMVVSCPTTEKEPCPVESSVSLSSSSPTPFRETMEEDSPSSSSKKKEVLMSTHVFFPVHYPWAPPIVRGKLLDPVVGASLPQPFHASDTGAYTATEKDPTNELFLYAFGSPFIQKHPTSSSSNRPCNAPSDGPQDFVSSAASVSEGSWVDPKEREEAEEEKWWGEQLDLERLRPFLALDHEEDKRCSSISSLHTSLLCLLVAVKEVFERFVLREAVVGALYENKAQEAQGKQDHMFSLQDGKGTSVGDGYRHPSLRPPLPLGTIAPSPGTSLLPSSSSSTSTSPSPSSSVPSSSAWGSQDHQEYTETQVMLGNAIYDRLYREASDYLSLRQRSLPFLMTLKYEGLRLQSTLEALKRKKTALRAIVPSKRVAPLPLLVRKLELALQKGKKEVETNRSAVLRMQHGGSASGRDYSSSMMSHSSSGCASPLPDDIRPSRSGGTSSILAVPMEEEGEDVEGGRRDGGGSSPPSPPPLPSLLEQSRGTSIAESCFAPSSELVKDIFYLKAEIDAKMDMVHLLDQGLHQQHLSCEIYVQHILHTAHDLFLDRFLLSRGEDQLRRGGSPMMVGGGQSIDPFLDGRWRSLRDPCPPPLSTSERAVPHHVSERRRSIRTSIRRRSGGEAFVSSTFSSTSSSSSSSSSSFSSSLPHHAVDRPGFMAAAPDGLDDRPHCHESSAPPPSLPLPSPSPDGPLPRHAEAVLSALSPPCHACQEGGEGEEGNASSGARDRDMLPVHAVAIQDSGVAQVDGAALLRTSRTRSLSSSSSSDRTLPRSLVTSPRCASTPPVSFQEEAEAKNTPDHEERKGLNAQATRTSAVEENSLDTTLLPSLASDEDTNRKGVRLQSSTPTRLVHVATHPVVDSPLPSPNRSSPQCYSSRPPSSSVSSAVEVEKEERHRDAAASECSTTIDKAEEEEDHRSNEPSGYSGMAEEGTAKDALLCDERQSAPVLSLSPSVSSRHSSLLSVSKSEAGKRDIPEDVLPVALLSMDASSQGTPESTSSPPPPPLRRRSSPSSTASLHSRSPSPPRISNVLELHEKKEMDATLTVEKMKEASSTLDMFSFSNARGNEKEEDP